MRKLLGKWGGAIRGPLLHAAMLLLLISPTLCHAQQLCTDPQVINSVTPSTWVAGKTYKIVVNGTGFYPLVDVSPGTGECYGTILGVSLDVGSVTLTNIVLVDSTEFTATVTPLATDPTETACVTVNNSVTYLDIVFRADAKPAVEASDSCPASLWTNWSALPVQIVAVCSTPTITSVSPPGWWAGKDSQDITINGGCFLTPSDKGGPSKVTATADGVALSNVNVVSANQITATVRVTKKAPAETVTLTVTNRATSRTPGSATANPAPVVLPVPEIQWRGKKISGDNANEKSVKVGQPVELTTTPTTLPGGFTVSKSTWDIDGTTIKHYDGDSSGITIDKDVDLEHPNTTFYWLYPDDPLNVTYEYCATDPNGNQICTSPQAKATFKATRPNIALNVTNPYNQAKVNELPLQAADGSCEKQKMAFMFYGNLHYASGCKSPYAGPVGIDLTPSGGNDGVYTFVQVISTDTITWDGQKPFHCGPYLNVLDGAFPFPGVMPPPPAAPTKAYDGPGQPLPNIYSSGRRDFHAVMHLLWQPPKLKGANADSISVPIGHQEWQFTAAANQNAPVGNGKWQQPTTAAAGKVGDFVPASDSDNAKYGYPVWGSVSTIGSCDAINQTQETEE